MNLRQLIFVPCLLALAACASTPGSSGSVTLDPATNDPARSETVSTPSSVPTAAATFPNQVKGAIREEGLYWYGLNDTSQIFRDGESNPYYDPTRSTMIFVHGWMPDQVTNPPTFAFSIPGAAEASEPVDLAASWLNAGWNVGFYYWHPYADEDAVWDAEDKIWTAETPLGMRRRNSDSSFDTENMPGVSASAMLFQDYVAAMAEFEGAEIRFAGHSLGNQMVSLLALKLAEGVAAGEIDPKLLPDRLALLDPFWSPFGKPYLDDRTTGEVLQEMISRELISQGTVVEWYRSSILTGATTFGDAAAQFREQVAFAEIVPDFCPGIDPGCRHEAAWHVYFNSFDEPPPQECVRDEEGSCEATGALTPMASMDNDTLAELMSEPFHWIQVFGPVAADGRQTVDTDDDWYERRPETE